MKKKRLKPGHKKAGPQKAQEPKESRSLPIILYALLAVIPLIFTRTSYLYWEIKYLAAIYLGVILLAVLFSRSSKKGVLGIPANPVNLPLLALILIGAAATLLANNRYLAFQIGSQEFFLFLPFLGALLGVHSRAAMEKLFAFSLAIASVVAAYGCLQYFGADEPLFAAWDVILRFIGFENTFWHRVGRHAVVSDNIPISTFGNRNWTSAYLAPQLIFGFFLLSRAKQLRARILISTAICLIGFTLVICRSRAAWLSLIGALFIVFALRHFKRIWGSLLYLAGTVLVFLILVLGFGPERGLGVRGAALTLAIFWTVGSLALWAKTHRRAFSENRRLVQATVLGALLIALVMGAVMVGERVEVHRRDQSMKVGLVERFMASFDAKEASFEARLISWANSLYLLKDQLARFSVLGAGPGNYRILYPLYIEAYGRDPDVDAVQRLRPHNETLQVAIELGPFGFLAWIWFLLAVLWLSKVKLGLKGPDAGLALVLSLSVFHTLLETNFEFVLENPGAAVVFWISLGFLARLPVESKDEVEESESALLRNRGLEWKLSPIQARLLLFGWLAVSALLVLPIIRPVSATAQLVGEYHKRTGKYFEERKLLIDCRDTYKKATSWAPGDYYNWFNYGHALQSLAEDRTVNGDPAGARAYYLEAVDALNRCLDLHPNFVEAMNNLGICYTQTKQFDLAREYYGKALSLDPLYKLAKYNLGMLDLNEGLALFGTAQKRKSADDRRTGLFQARALLVSAKERMSDAGRVNLRHFQQRHNMASILQNLGLVEMQLGFREDGIAYLEEAAVLLEEAIRNPNAPKNSDLHLGVNYQFRGLYKEAVVALDRYLKDHPDSAEARSRREACLDLISDEKDEGSADRSSQPG